MDLNDKPLTHMTVFPEVGEGKDVAKLLLELADHPNQVMTTLDPTLGFRVPLWLYETFVTIWDLRSASVASADASADIEVTEPPIPAESGPESIEAVKRKPGRPRKEVQ